VPLRAAEHREWLDITMPAGAQEPSDRPDASLDAEAHGSERRSTARLSEAPSWAWSPVSAASGARHASVTSATGSRARGEAGALLSGEAGAAAPSASEPHDLINLVEQRELERRTRIRSSIRSSLGESGGYRDSAQRSTYGAGAAVGVETASRRPPPSLSDGRNELTGNDLRRYRWRFVRGVDDFVETPVGRFALVRGSEATGAGKRHPLRLDISTKLMTIKLKIWSLVFFYGTAVHNILQTVEVVNNQEDMSHALFPEDNAFWIPYLTNDLVLTLGYIFYLGALGILLYRKVYNDWLHWPRMPMPLRCTGKIEYALFWACYISIQWMVIARGKCMLSQECPGLLHTQSFVNNSNLSEASLIDNVVAVDEPIYLVLAVNSCFLIVAFALSLYEGLIAVVNACVGAYRYRHPGYLSEIWERSFLQEGHELR